MHRALSKGLLLLSLAAAAFAVAHPLRAQGINLRTQVQGQLQPSNGGLGISAVGLSGCPLFANGVVTINSANCSQSSGSVASGSTYSPAYYTANGAAIGGVTPFAGLAWFSLSGPPAAASATQIQNAIGLGALTQSTAPLCYTSGTLTNAGCSTSAFVNAANYSGAGPAERANQATIYAIDNHISTVDTSAFLGLQPVSQEQWNRLLHVTTATTNPDPTQCNATRLVGYRWYNSSSGARWTCQSTGQWVPSMWDGNFNGLTFILPGVAQWPFNVPDPQAVAIMDGNGISAIGPATGGGGSQFKVYPASSSVNMWAMHAIDQQYGDGLYVRTEGTNYSNGPGATMGSGAVDITNGNGLVDESAIDHMYVGNSTGDAFRFVGCCGAAVHSGQGYSAYGSGGGIPFTFTGGAAYDITANAAGTGFPNILLPVYSTTASGVTTKTGAGVEPLFNIYTETQEGADTTTAVIDNQPLNAGQPIISLYGWNAPALGSKKPAFSHPLMWGLVNLGGNAGAQNYIGDGTTNHVRLVPNANFQVSPLSTGNGNNDGQTDAGVVIFTPTAPGYYTVGNGNDFIGSMECLAGSGEFAITYGLSTSGGVTNVMRMPLDASNNFGVQEVDKVLTTTDGNSNQSIMVHVSNVPASNAAISCTFRGQGINTPGAASQGVQQNPTVMTSLPTGTTITWSDDLTQQGQPNNPTLLLSGGLGATALIPPADHAHPIAIPTGRTGSMVTSEQIGTMAAQNANDVDITGGEVFADRLIYNDGVNAATPYSATPAFDALWQVNSITLTGNLTSFSFFDLYATDQRTCVIFQQDSTGGRSVSTGSIGNIAVPANFTIDQRANSRTMGCWFWSGNTWLMRSVAYLDDIPTPSCAGSSCPLGNQTNVAFGTSSSIAVSANIATGDTTFTLANTTGIPAVGCGQIADTVSHSEAFCWSGTTATTLTGLTRGLWGTTATAFSTSNSPVFLGFTQLVGTGINNVPGYFVMNNGITVYGQSSTTFVDPTAYRTQFNNSILVQANVYGQQIAGTNFVNTAGNLYASLVPFDYGSLTGSTTLTSNAYNVHATCATAGITITLAPPTGTPQQTTYQGQTYTIVDSSTGSCTIAGNGTAIGNVSTASSFTLSSGAAVRLHNDGTAFRQE